ncbi:MAG: hypothetical protein R3E97_07290 [Candidatus Eisenbacteria bacterium]
MATSSRVLRTLRLLAFCLLATLFAEPARCEPTISVRTHRVLLPLIDDADLETGWVETDPARGQYAIEVEVSSKAKSGGWVLYIHSDGSSFRAGSADKPSSDLMWKVDEAPASAYERLEEQESIVLAMPQGGDARVLLDVRVRLDWTTESGPLGAGIVFRVAPY